MKFRDEILAKGFTHALLLGMGGSSLAPEVMSLIQANERERAVGLDLAILDSTDPVQVLAAYARSSMEKTLYIVSSKSGTTSEINAYLDYFWANAQKELGEKASEHFVAITDPGTPLEKLASERKFTRIFQADPKVGGRYSALTLFGLVPAGLIGMDLAILLENARQLAEMCKPDRPVATNPGAVLGACLGEAWKQGMDKLTILADAEWSSFGSWMEQLVAESSGKDGRGIVPVDQEPLIAGDQYGKDRLFVYIRKNGEHDLFVQELNANGHPVLVLDVKEPSDLGSMFFIMEIATAFACAVLQVNPFDQPDVQDSKTRTQTKVDLIKKGIPSTERKPTLVVDGIKLFGNLDEIKTPHRLADVVLKFLEDNGRMADYVAINAYLPRNPGTHKALQAFRKMILEKTRKATTLGFGPRFQHSTGQLHKGGSDEGIFIQIVANHLKDIEIPTENIKFGEFECAQADGDLDALEARKRRVLRIELPEPDARILFRSNEGGKNGS